MGDRQANLAHAVALLEAQGIEIVRSSSTYRTAAWGKTDQPDFFNQAIEVATALSPEQLLETCLKAEKQLGRKRLEKWAERVIDIDILFYGDATVDVEGLTVPHPQIQNRRFTLLPMVELAPEFIHPIFQKTMKILLAECADPLAVERIS
jgi:2-amino-4-hydroxy-6-hydroxymethyldihydropteridine diphosphokinase